MKKMATSSKLATVEELGEANSAVLVGSRSTPAERSVKFVDELVVVSILIGTNVKQFDCLEALVDD